MGRELERRRYIRFSGRWLIHYARADKELFEETYTANLSMGGFCFDTAESIPASILLKLRIRITEYLEPIETLGVVVRSHPKEKGPGFETAVRLVSASDEDWERLVDWALCHQKLIRRKNAGDSGRVVEGENPAAEIGTF
ncbi:MAG: PilZ domain-containing protein [Candidatus Omnitrophica bacterium]|nr:PilZ domain-containing protein [Candidatus Omnitrophota bacterium]